MGKRILIVLITMFVLMSCDKDDDNSVKTAKTEMNDVRLVSCGFKVLIDSELYRVGSDSPLVINNLELKDNCLKVNYSSGGCNGDTWEIQLIDSGGVSKSNPVQRYLKLSLKNEEECEAYITKEISFDISNLKDNGESSVLNIEKWNTPIVYKY